MLNSCFVINWFAGILFVFGSTLGLGYFIFQSYAEGFGCIFLSVLGGVIIWNNIKRASTTADALFFFFRIEPYVFEQAYYLSFLTDISCENIYGEVLLVEGGVYLIDHVLEGLRLIKDGTFFHKPLCVIEKLGFIKAGIFFNGVGKVKFTDIFII